MKYTVYMKYNFMIFLSSLMLFSFYKLLELYIFNCLIKNKNTLEVPTICTITLENWKYFQFVNNNFNIFSNLR